MPPQTKQDFFARYIDLHERMASMKRALADLDLELNGLRKSVPPKVIETMEWTEIAVKNGNIYVFETALDDDGTTYLTDVHKDTQVINLP